MRIEFERQFDREAHAGGAEGNVFRQRRLVVDVEKRTDHMRPSSQKMDGRHVVGLDRVVGLDQLGYGADLTLGSRHRERRMYYLFAAAGEALDCLEHHVGAEWKALRAHDLPDAHAVDRRLVGDAGVEVDPLLSRPVEQNRPKREAETRDGCAHRHALR